MTGAGQGAGGGAGKPDEAAQLLADLGVDIAATEGTVETRREKAEADNIARKGADRSYLARTIIVIYGFSVLGVIAYLLAADIVRFGVICSRGADHQCIAALTAWPSRTEGLVEIITIAVVPIVTLMLGFYFGTESGKGGKT